MPLLGLSLFLGFYPKPVLDRLQPSVDALVTHVDAHSDHKQPAVEQFSATCERDASGTYVLHVRKATEPQQPPNEWKQSSGDCTTTKAGK